MSAIQNSIKYVAISFVTALLTIGMFHTFFGDHKPDAETQPANEVSASASGATNGISSTIGQTKLISVEEAAKQLGIDGMVLKVMISQEEQYLKENATISGVMFPKIIIKGKVYVIADLMDEWLKSVHETGRDMIYQ